MSLTRHSTLVWLPLVLAVSAAPSLARAQELTLQEAKRQGWVGEQSDGFLGLVTEEAPPSARDLMKRINTRRTDIYAGIAKQEGISVVAVAVRSGERLIGEAAPGEWVWENGGWRRRGS
jgi:uncharacterized protein